MTREEAKEVLIYYAEKNIIARTSLGIAMNMAIQALEQEPCEDAISRQVEIVRCKDCRKQNVSVGYKKDCCPLYEFRGISYGHEHDYQFCCFAERRTDE